MGDENKRNDQSGSQNKNQQPDKNRQNQGGQNRGVGSNPKSEE